MRFWLGLAIGLALGAIGTYLALAPPWRDDGAAVTPAVASADTPDGGVTPAKKKGRRKARGVGGGTTGEPEPYDVDETITLTEADRRLEWRGEAVALPPRTMDMSSGGDDGRPMDDAEIQNGINGGSGPFIGCIKDATAGAELSAEVTLQMLVSGEGRVGKMRVRAPAWLHEHGLLACARKAARNFGFPSTGAPTVVTAPFHLN